jgi:hypothetical protein
MHRLGMSVAYLFTGRVGFYERVGFRVVRQPGFRAVAREAASVPGDAMYRIRPISHQDDARGLLRIYRASTARSTGAIARAPRIWRDAQTWLGEDAEGCFVAVYAGRPVAYIRARRRIDDYQVLEAEHLRGHDAAIAPLLAAAASRANTFGAPIVASVPDDHALATALRTLPATTWSTGIDHVPHPMMMRIISLDGLLEALLPGIRERARTHRGARFALTMHGPDGEQATLAIAGANASLRQRPGEYALDERATLDVIFGQGRASRLMRPRPPREIARRVEAIFPETALHFWNSDRI